MIIPAYKFSIRQRPLKHTDYVFQSSFKIYSGISITKDQLEVNVTEAYNTYLIGVKIKLFQLRRHNVKE